MSGSDYVKRGSVSVILRGLALSAALAAAMPAAGQLFGGELRFAAGDAPQTVSIGDLDGDGVVGSGDLAILLAAWGSD